MPNVGDVFGLGDQNGQTVPVKVVAVEGDTVTLDGNHPLAGKDLTFEVEIVEVVDMG